LVNKNIFDLFVKKNIFFCWRRRTSLILSLQTMASLTDCLSAYLSLVLSLSLAAHVRGRICMSVCGCHRERFLTNHNIILTNHSEPFDKPPVHHFFTTYTHAHPAELSSHTLANTHQHSRSPHTHTSSLLGREGFLCHRERGGEEDLKVDGNTLAEHTHTRPLFRGERDLSVSERKGGGRT